MYKLAKGLVIIILLIVACKPTFKPNSEIRILKVYYRYGSYYFPVYLDSIKDIISIRNKLDSLCDKYDEACSIGIVYNLLDSSFIPAKDSAYNIIVHCGTGNRPHGKYRISSYSILINTIDSDSIAIFDYYHDFRTRMHINMFKDYFSNYLIKNDLKNLASDEYVLIAIDISNNPPKELFKKIFRIAFWTYYSNKFSSLINNPKINLEHIESDTDAIDFMMAPLHIHFIRDTNNFDFRYKDLTP
jgi:hypothetical protein